MVGHDEDKRNPSTVDRSHQLALTHLRQPLVQMSLLQHPIIKAVTFGERSHPTISLTTGWLLGDITRFSNEEYTPSSGWGHYPTTIEVIPLFVSAVETLKRILQITQDTFHGIRKDGEDETVAHHHWWIDVFPNLFFDDRLWAHMIRGAEWLHVVDRTKINNTSLLLLLRMGVLNWKTPNNRLHQATQAIRHGTAIMLRLLPRIMKLESRVRRVIERHYKVLLTLLLLGGRC